MIRLILDRSCEVAGFALAEDEKILCEKIWKGGGGSPDWFAEMSGLLRGAGCRAEDIDEFVCAVGPGSFSGIRSALAALEGMALPGGRPVVGISSAAALAFEYGGESEGGVCVIGDARRSSLWLASFRRDADRGLVLNDGSDVTQSADDFTLADAQTIEPCVPPDTLVLSPDYDRIGDLLVRLFPRSRLIARRLSSRAEVMAVMAARFPSLGRVEPVPVYLHPAVAP